MSLRSCARILNVPVRRMLPSELRPRRTSKITAAVDSAFEIVLLALGIADPVYLSLQLQPFWIARHNDLRVPSADGMIPHHNNCCALADPFFDEGSNFVRRLFLFFHRIAPKSFNEGRSEEEGIAIS